MSEEPVRTPYDEAAANPWVAQIQAINERTYSATSPDGHVSVEVGGDQRLRSVHFATSDLPPARAGQAATAAISEALAVARRASTAAMRDLPGLTPEMRRLLDGQA